MQRARRGSSRVSPCRCASIPAIAGNYGVAVDVQGRLLEVLAGRPLHEVLGDRIFQPLGMTETAFQAPADKLSRVAQPAPGTNGKTTTPRFKVDDGARYESGGCGLTSTTEDYLRFTAALANGGYGWSGAAGTTFWVDPKEQLYAIYMVQANAADTRDLRTQFRTMIQAALLD